jgi:hypothetical protein
MTQSTRLRATLKNIRRRKPTVRQPLALNWEMAVLWLWLRAQADPEYLVYDLLMQTTVIDLKMQRRATLTRKDGGLLLLSSCGWTRRRSSSRGCVSVLWTRSAVS